MARYLSPDFQQVLEVYEPILWYKKSRNDQKNEICPIVLSTFPRSNTTA